MSEKIRLDKMLSESGFGTRSEVKEILNKKRVKLNDTMTKDGSAKIDPVKDIVKIDDVEIKYRKHLYYMLNKPQGVISATKDGLSSTVLECLDGEPTRDLFPVGRLDKDTEGLLLITNDGNLAHNMLSPKKHVDKTYFAVTDKLLNPDETEKFKRGLDIGDEKPTLPAELETFERHNKYGYLVTIREGRYHQIKRMFEVFGANVIYLERLTMGNLKLDETLTPGEYRELSEEEIKSIISK